MSSFNLSELFESVVDAVGDRVAIASPARRLTYAELDERANRLAHHLAAHGIGAGDHIGLQLLNDRHLLAERVLGDETGLLVLFRRAAGLLEALGIPLRPSAIGEKNRPHGSETPTFTLMVPVRPSMGDRMTV